MDQVTSSSRPNWLSKIINFVGNLIHLVVSVFVQYMLIVIIGYLLYSLLHMNGIFSEQFHWSQLAYFFSSANPYWVLLVDILSHHLFLYLFWLSIFLAVITADSNSIDQQHNKLPPLDMMALKPREAHLISTYNPKSDRGTNLISNYHSLLAVICVPLGFVIDPLLTNNYPITYENVVISLDMISGIAFLQVLLFGLSYFAISFSWRAIKYEFPSFWSNETFGYSLAYIAIITVIVLYIIPVLLGNLFNVVIRPLDLGNYPQVETYDPLKYPPLLRISNLFSRSVQFLHDSRQNLSLINVFLYLLGAVAFIGGVADGIKALKRLAIWIRSIYRRKSINRTVS